MHSRKAAYAGSWYPARAAECEAEIKRFIDTADDQDDAGGTFVGGVVPHAGWYFSGEIACRVIYAISQGSQPDVIVLFGMHLHPGSPNYIMTQGAWETPFGDLHIATELASRLNETFSFQVETAQHHTQDNTIELQLPFIKYFFGNTQIVPIGVPPADTSLAIGETVAKISSDLGLSIRVIGSTDLTHYGVNYGFTDQGAGPSAVDWVVNENDRRIVDAMLAMDSAGVIREGMTHQNACCAGAAAAAIAAGKKLGATQAVKLAYATSYDKSPGNSFVGYAGILFK